MLILNAPLMPDRIETADGKRYNSLDFTAKPVRVELVMRDVVSRAPA